MSRKLDEATLRSEARSVDETYGLVDMCIEFAFEEDPNVPLLTVGGKWDPQEPSDDGKRLGNYRNTMRRGIPDASPDIEPESAVHVLVHPGQLRGLQWFKRWLAKHRERRQNPPKIAGERIVIDLDEILAEIKSVDESEVYSALFAGGRRSGKTWLAGALALAYAVEFPDSIVWLVSKNEGKHPEMRRYIVDHLDVSWVEREVELQWTLINGSVIELRSAHDPEALKRGEAHFVLLNEGQTMTKRAYTVARGAVVDHAGIVLICANPPTERGDQGWITDFAAKAMSGRQASVYIEFNPLDNPHIHIESLLALAHEVDERTFEIEVLGLFRGPKDAVVYNWIRTENERKPPRAFDITEAFMREVNEGEGIRHVVGLDVQRFPHIGGPVYHFFGETPDPESVRAWIVDEVVFEGGDEEMFCQGLLAKGYLPDETLIICDASGRYQATKRVSVEAMPQAPRGRGSFDIIREAGFYRIVPPDRKLLTNPHIVDRMRAFTSLVKAGKTRGVGLRRLFADPDRAPKTCEAIRDWRTLHGLPHRQQEAAHLGDAASYPISRLFPRRLKAGKTGEVDPVAARVDLASREDLPVRLMPAHRGPAPRRGVSGSE